MLKEVKLIYCEKEQKGKGTTDDPIRIIYELYSHDGLIVAWFDPVTKEAMFDPHSIQ